MYGQNNGNGGGDYDELMSRLNQTKPVTESNRDPFIAVGEHDLIVKTIETYTDSKWGKSVRATFEVESSPSHPKGSSCVKIWNLFKPSKFPSQATDADQFADFVCKLQGVPEGQHAQGCRTLLKGRAEGGNAEAQPARGARIHAKGVPTNGTYVRVFWRSVQQDMAAIAKECARLDAQAGAAQQAQAQYPTAPQNGGGYSYAQPQPAPQQPAAPAPQVGGWLGQLPPK